MKHTTRDVVTSLALTLNWTDSTYPTYREQLITEVGEELLLLRVVHVRWFEASLGDQRAVDAGRALDVIEAVLVDDPIVNLVDARHLVRGVLTLAYRHHFH